MHAMATPLLEFQVQRYKISRRTYVRFNLSQNHVRLKHILSYFIFSLEISFSVFNDKLTTSEKNYFGKLGPQFLSSPSFDFKRYETTLCNISNFGKNVVLNFVYPCFHIKPNSTDGYELEGGSRFENISDLFDRILAPCKVKRKIDSTI